MKKMLIAVAVVLAAGIMTSCNKGEGCYRLDAKVTTTIAGTDVTVDADPYYVYGDGEDISKAKEDFKETLEALGGTAKITQIKVAKSKEDCEAANK